MCGICGVATDGPPPDLGVALAMIGRLRHRGPDGSGYYRDDQTILGHARLAIIDTAGGAQPLANEDDTVWVTFNGEIFNYVELRAQLRDRGHRFRTASDTEVIVHAWEEWGPECFARFNGQWSIAIWERLNRRLVLSRDRMGVRPLYYHLSPHRILFASEVKAIFADPSVPRALDAAGLKEVLTFWSTIAPRTQFAGIDQLPPGHYATWDRHGLQVAPYFRMEFPQRGAEAGQDLATNAAGLRERVVEATRLRFLRSDVPVGAYLSGGIDSSVTAAVIRRFTDAPLHTFSLRFADAEFDEGIFQRQMSRALGTDHKDVVVSGADIVGIFPEVIWHAEATLLRAAPAPLFLLSRLVRENGFKVVVTGEGADEVLGGYDLFREARARLFWARDPKSAVRGRAAEMLYPWMVRNPAQAPQFARAFFGQHLDPTDPGLSHRPRWNSTSALLTMLSPVMREAVAASPATDIAGLMPSESVDWDPLSRAQWLETTTLLPGYILASQGDRMLMANSVEGRFPFLDPNVVAYSNALPARHKLFGLEEKALLKHAFADLVPEAIRNRPKQPYRAPDAASFFTGDRPDWLETALSREAVLAAGIFEPGQVDGVMSKAARRGGAGMGNTDNMRVLAVVSTQLLHQQFIAGSWPIPEPKPSEPLSIADLTTQERESDDSAVWA